MTAIAKKRKSSSKPKSSSNKKNKSTKEANKPTDESISDDHDTETEPASVPASASHDHADVAGDLLDTLTEVEASVEVDTETMHEEPVLTDVQEAMVQSEASMVDDGSIDVEAFEQELK